MLKRIMLSVVAIALLSGVIANAGDLKLRYPITDNLSIGVDNGSAISYWDFKDRDLLSGYAVPLVLYQFPDTFLKGYDISLDGGIVGNFNDVDGILGIGSNAPKVVAQYLIDQSINKVMNTSFIIPERVKIGLVERIDTSELFDNGKLNFSTGLIFGIKF